MPIGRFARAARLSVKSLRNYDAAGLLPAAFVDPQSGYRYYRLEQLAQAAMIRSLRAVDMPLARIADVLSGEGWEEALTSQLDALIAQRDQHDRMLQELQRLIARKELDMSATVTVKTLPAHTAAFVRTATTHATIFTDIPAGTGQVLGALDRAGADPIGAPYTVFHQAPDADSAGDIALCIPVVAGAALAGVDTVDVDEVLVASLVHEGSYEAMAESYASIAAWIHEHGHRIVGPTREVYLNSPADVAEDALRTEIQFPIDPT